MTDFNKLITTLQDYCELTIFEDVTFLNLANFNWLGKFNTIQVNDVIYNSYEEALSNNLGLHFGFNFTLNPWPGDENYTKMIDGLNKFQFCDRYKSKVLIRKLFIFNDDIKIDSAISELYNDFGELSNSVLGWLKMSTSNINSGSFLRLSLPPKKIPDDLNISKLGDRRNLKREDILKQGLGPGDLLLLFLYSGDIHFDEDKLKLYKIYQNHFGNFLESIIDMYSVILYKMSKHLIIPMIKGHLKK